MNLKGDVSPDASPIPGVPGAGVRKWDGVPIELDDAERVGGYSVARPGALLQLVKGIGRFLSTNGNLIQFALEENADPLAVEEFLAASPRAALVHQRGGLPLHGSCVIPPSQDFAVALTGPSGAGKSTLAAELLRRGWSLLGDDVTPVYADADLVTAWPSRSGLKLCRDACSDLKVDSKRLIALPGERDKFLIRTDAKDDPMRLGCILQLERGDGHGLRAIEGPARLAALAANTYKLNYVSGLKCIESHLRICCQISQKVEMAVLRWKKTAGEGADLLESFCNTVSQVRNER